jgi:hypothetical protein
MDDLFRNSIPNASPSIFRGITKRKEIVQHWKENKDFYYMDTGYFGNFASPGNRNGTKIFHRIVKNDVQKHWLENHSIDRWEEICKIDSRYKWNGWKNNGKKILIIVPSRKSCVFYGHDIEPYVNNEKPWLMNTIATIKKHTDMEIVIREKGSRSSRQRHSIFDALNEGIFATVAFNSIAALESVIYGIPSFVTVPCAASPLALSDLSKIENPWYPDASLVRSHCASLAYGQFTVEEIANGTAWKLLNK